MGYVLGIYEGKLALFTKTGNYPNKIYDLWVKNLPEDDAALLEQGIFVETEQELFELLEDLTS